MSNPATGLRGALRQSLVRFGERVLLPWACAGDRPVFPPAGRPVHVVISSRTARMSVLAIQSLEWFTQRTWDVYFHDDGTVTADLRAFIDAGLPGAVFIPRDEADRRAENALAGYPASRRLRARHNYLLKIFDPLLVNGGVPWLLMDADVFFFRRPPELEQWLAAPDRFFHMVDTRECYAHSREEIVRRTGIAPAARLNAGLCTLPAGALSLEDCEQRLAALEPGCEQPMFLDQTLLALSAGERKAAPLGPEYEITWNLFRRRESVCRHYVGPAKFDHFGLEGPASLLMLLTLPRYFGRHRRATGHAETPVELR
ncbi:MAG: hypothetical protein SFU53_03450 [Terrimicrobiaceae bacterium]|nr:hypothetical protein [Terrimicrobiaceae bacterium]